ncbi:aspartyl protease [Rhizobium sp. ACO-34A]|nr:TIGR02281 family clan AA aspartic protease [Rhizobium sp. ACO-34A]ATN32489.1 aspartyl protease [Rhizobium sp. ACO-34A]
MLVRTLVFVSAAVVLATQVPRFLEKNAEAVPATAPAADDAAATPVSLPSGVALLKADGRGHYIGSFKMNGKPVEGLVDTGASLIAINETTARRLGISIAGLDFKYAISTANGKTDAAGVILQRVEIGTVRVEKVEAFVLRDNALSNTLIGMSFLKRLSAYAAEGDTMRLTR